MPPTPSDQVRLARLDAKLWEDSSYAYIQHEFYGWQTAPQQHFVWRRAWKPIGQGGFGAVFSEECIEGASKGSMRAVKSLQKPSTINSRSIDYGRELEAIARFSRPEYAQFFVQSSGWYEDSQAVFIVMELVSHGNLQQHIGLGLSEIETTRIVRQVLQGLSCMHREGYTHRDMKPQNLLVVRGGPEWHVKISDFGLSKRVAEQLSSLRTVAGTPGFIAPEVQGLLLDEDSDESEDSDRSPRKSYTDAVDIWAVGAISFMLLTGELPFPTQNLKGLRKYVIGKAAFPVDKLETKSVSVPGCEAIEKLMRPNPGLRPSADAALETVWLRVAPSHMHAVPPTVVQEAAPSDPSLTSEASARWTTIADTEYPNVDLQDHTKTKPAPSDSAYQTVVPSHARDRPAVSKDATKTTYSWKGFIEMRSSRVRCLAFSPDGKLLASATGDETAKLWTGTVMLLNMDGERQAIFNVSKKDIVWKVAFWRDGEHVVAVTTNWISVWNKSGERVKDIEMIVPPSKFKSDSWAGTAISQDGRLAARAQVHGLVRVWDVVSGKLHKELRLDGSSPYGGISTVAISPNNGQLAGGTGGVGAVWDLASSNRSGELAYTGMWPLAFSPDGQLLACKERGGVTLLDLKLKKRSLKSDEDVYAAAFSPDGRLLVSGGRLGDVALWDVSTGAMIRKLEGHYDSVWAVAFSPDGRLVATGDRAGAIRLWEVHAL